MQPSAPGELSDRLQQLETSWRAERKTCRARGVRGRPVFHCLRTSGRESKQEGRVMKEAGSRGTRGEHGAVCKRPGEEVEEADGRKVNFKVEQEA